MSDEHPQPIIALTGSFGSGCTTVGKVLEERYKFKRITISDYIKDKASERGIEITRENLQRVGNELRGKYGNGFLASKALNDINEENTPCVVEAVRNFGEIDELRKHPNFYLMAVDCSKEKRWERLKNYYENKERFLEEDERDANEKIPHGQQVQKCVEQADIIFNNETKFSEKDIKPNLELRLNRYVDLILGEENNIEPQLEETRMTLAATVALQSECHRRKVGAVIFDENGEIISTGYNQVQGEQSCIEQYNMCYRHFLREKKGYSENEKLLSYCRALHAEQNAIVMSSKPLEGGTLYVTTFPCNDCAKMISKSGIRKVVYIHPYPMEEAMNLLNERGIMMEKFEGVKAKGYYKLFAEGKRIHI